ncbi:DUF982 domain-containing protein [Mesorhizobium atlanticum]
MKLGFRGQCRWPPAYLARSNNLSNANQAIDVLTKQWRYARSPKHLAALRACRQATNGGIAADVAREAAVDAAREAHMLVE